MRDPSVATAMTRCISSLILGTVKSTTSVLMEYRTRISVLMASIGITSTTSVRTRQRLSALEKATITNQKQAPVRKLRP